MVPKDLATGEPRKKSFSLFSVRFFALKNAGFKLRMNNCGIYNFDLVIPIKTKTKNKKQNKIKIENRIQ